MLSDESETPPLHEPLPRLPSPPPLISVPPAHVPPRSIVRPVVVEPERGLQVELAGLTVSGQSYQQASQLDEQVAARLRGISQQVQRHAIVPQIKAGSRDISRALALIRTRSSLRSVIMASVILGPPKALEAS